MVHRQEAVEPTVTWVAEGLKLRRSFLVLELSQATGKVVLPQSLGHLMLLAQPESVVCWLAGKACQDERSISW